ncbi:MAG: winged helix-turn-helix domain-containing protein [Planctomycetes bacterium]|nr:winged helix-turn-helix domain-containing protein [Planctomycetota bacterium]
MYRFVPPLPVANPRHTSKPCQRSDCEESTREGKPFCPQHVDHNPYAQHLLAKLEDLEREHRRVRLRGPAGVNLQGETCQEILRELGQQGRCSVARLAQTLALPYPLISSYVQALARSGRVVTSGFRRDRLQVQLSGGTPRSRRRGCIAG